MEKKDYIPTGVTFATNDAFLEKLFQAAEAACKTNEQDFSGRKVLVEGGGYDSMWIETQPMGGEMYAKRDMEAAWNNTLFYLEYQLMNGRYPYRITRTDGRIYPFYTHFQGFCFPHHALNLFYWDKKRDRDYLGRLRKSLEAFDSYLWTWRDSDGDGCLESWCVWDTGEDNSNRFAGTGLNVGGFPGETPPDDPVFPQESMDVMGYSHDARATVAALARLLGDESGAALWDKKAAAVREKIRAYLWDEVRGACFDRDRENRVIPILTHNNLRVMYFGGFDQEMAGRFVREHLFNPREFFTPMPLPSIAVNDPAFRNVRENDWSGQPEGLTYQRAIRALENYGFYPEMAILGEKLIDRVGRRNIFTQQFDPFTGELSEPESRTTYGPTALAVLEYFSRLWGVHVQFDELWWGCLGRPGAEMTYTQRWGDDTFTVETGSREARGLINGREVFRVDTGVRVVTDWQGGVKSVFPLRGGVV